LSTGLNYAVAALAEYNGNLIAGGYFSGDQSLNYIAQWDGASWQPLGTGMNDNVYALSVYDGALFAAGHFTKAGGITVNRMARWDGLAWSPLGVGTNNDVYALTMYGGQLIAAGNFTTVANKFATSWAPWGPNCPRGDMNCDQIIDLNDLPLFIDALLNAPALSTCDAYTANVNADVLSDGTPKIDGLDIQAFVAALIQ
jgi:hypothetical protein